MDQRTEERIEGWETKPLTGGFAELRELADGGFSGVARTGPTTLFMLNGRAVGVVGGSIEAFERGEATVAKAPHPSLPLLFAMTERGGEQQAKYYTNDTPISEAHDQLTEAGFTGYIELSENVLSGDYYVVYQGGRSLSCAFVGNAERLKTGDEAFELADDEVGIYEVISVDLDVVDIPDPGGADATGSAEAAGSTEADATGSAGADATGSAGEAGGTAGPAGGAAGRTDPGAHDDAAATGREQGAGPAGGRGHPGETPADPDSGGTGGDDGGGAAAGPREGVAGDDPAPGPRDGDGQAGRGPGEVTDPDPQPADGRPSGEDAGTDPADGVGPDEGEVTAERSERAGGGHDRPSGTNAGGRPSEADPGGRPSEADPGGRPSEADPGADAPGGDAEVDRAGTAADRAVEAASGAQGSSANGAASAGEGVPREAAAFGELRAIPSLSPDHTAVAETGGDRGAAGGRDEPEPTADAGATEMSSGAVAEDAPGASDGASGAADDATGSSGTGVGRDPAGSTGAGSSGVPEGGSVGSGTGASGDRPGTDVTERASQAVDVEPEEPAAPAAAEAGDGALREQLAAREERIEELEAAITDLRVQRDGLTDERDRLQEEVERLQGEIAELEAEIERLHGQLDDGADGKRRLSPDEALGATNLFVRYDSKGGGTLEDAHAGEVEAEEVNENLRLEHHTQFDAGEVVVGDQPFETFLGGTVAHEFVEWVVRDLLYEIRDTGHVKGLAELYDAIPKIDRAELFGDVSVRFTEDGEQYREQRSFDVVLRDRMGDPLIVANLNDSRTPADREMMETIIQNGIDVKESNESLSSAMLVTASFFKPGALEAADETQGGGLLSRESKESYVRLNRKSGYHLVLVESREGDFHVNVPEL